MPEDNSHPTRPVVLSYRDQRRPPDESMMVSDIIAQLAMSDSIEEVERTLESALEFVRLTRAKRDRARFGDE